MLCAHKKLSTSTENVALLGVLNRIRPKECITKHYFVVPEVGEYNK
jgi:hypothetical protein